MQNSNMHIEIVDFSLQSHFRAFEKLLNNYMVDKMGAGFPLNSKKRNVIISDLKKHSSYIGFLVNLKNEYVALANCFVNYSTFQASHLLNIHDFVVHSNYRQLGVGSFLLKSIEDYASGMNYCRLNLEVREDNLNAMLLYQKHGFKPCIPGMYFWEKKIVK